jgi:hypothetical protein
MEGGLILIGILVFAVYLYQQVLPKFQGPKAIVRALLRRYHLFERAGLPERESLFRVLASRSGWRKLPQPFLVELIARLKTKESVFRFVSLAEGYGYHRKELPAIARNPDVNDAMNDIGGWLSDFGMRMQNENRLKEAEFVQGLALALLPDRPSTMLPLAATYYKMERYADAVPLFKKGLAGVGNSADGAPPIEKSRPSPNGPSPAKADESIAAYEGMYADCLKAATSQREVSS